MAKKRDKLAIIYDMLRVIDRQRDPMKPTHILYQANLSHQKMESCLAELIDKNMIVERSVKNKTAYAITEKGREFIQEFVVIRGFIDSYGL